MAWTDHIPFDLPFLGDTRGYQVPWVKFRTPEGDWAEGPMIRQGRDRREILTWTDRNKAVEAARELVNQSGGTFEVRVLDRKAVQAECRRFSAWGSRVVAVVLK